MDGWVGKNVVEQINWMNGWGGWVFGVGIGR